MSTHGSELTASQKRAAHPDFIALFSLGAVCHQWPWRFPVPDQTPPSPKRHYRSLYRYLGYHDLTQLSTLATLTLFDVALRLFDFSSLRDYLAQFYYQTSSKGQVPFDPVSLFLCICLRREWRYSWRKLADLLAGEHGAVWRLRFGFCDGVTPSASGLRFFFHAVGPQVFENINGLMIDLLHQAHLIPERSTFPGDPPSLGVALSHDLMLHQARSNMKCAYVTSTCYQPAPRPCPAKQAGKEGCDCREASCIKICRRATPRDSEARYIYYEGRNKTADLPTADQPRGRDVYGYASAPDRLLDDRLACAWTLCTNGLHPANADERTLFPVSFAALQRRYPWLVIGEVLADAALGYQNCLDPIWNAGARRLVDIRADQGDEDPQVQPRRGYDENGHPVCLHGYKMRSNGHDYHRRRTKWCCHQACQHVAQHPPPDCPHRDAQHTYGQIVNVGRTLPDGSTRLAREVPYHSQLWNKHYARRNLSESRNGSQQAMGLKRLPSFGQPHGHAEVALGDLLDNLHTISRLVREATALALQNTTS